jgi:acylphosphatase
MDRQAVRLSIRGRVQGVGYRWWAIREARRLRLDGWVRNRHDGSVEILAVGSAVAIETFVEACRHGPRGATVTEVDRADAQDTGGAGFEERPTA